MAHRMASVPTLSPEAAAKKVQAIFRQRQAHKRVRLLRELRRVECLVTQEVHADKPLTRQKLLPLSGLLECARSRLLSRRGFHTLRGLVLYTGVLLVMIFTAQGDFQSQHDTETVLLDVLVVNSTKTNGVSWRDIKSEWDFRDWHDNLLVPAGWSNRAEVAYGGNSYGYKEFVDSVLNNTFTLTNDRQYVFEGTKWINERQQIVGDVTWVVTRHDLKTCDTKYDTLYYTTTSPLNCFSDSTTEAIYTYPPTETWNRIKDFHRPNLLNLMDRFAGTVHLELATWNPNTRLIGYIILQLDVSFGGKWSPSINSVGVIQMEQTKGALFPIWVASFVLFIAGTIVLTAHWVFSVYQDRTYIQDGWHKLDAITQLIAIAYIGLVGIFEGSVHPSVAMHSQEYYFFQRAVLGVTGQGENSVARDDFESILASAPYLQAIQVTAALLIFCFFLRMCKCVQYEGKIGLITSMLMNCANDMFHLMVFLVVFWICMACVGMALFGHSCEAFSTLGYSIESLFLFVFGYSFFDYTLTTGINKFLGPFYFISYLIMCGLIMFNVFVAVLMDGYSEVKANPRMQTTLVEEVAEGFDRRFRKCRNQESDSILDVPELIQVLEHWGSKNPHAYVSYKNLRKRLGGPLTKRTDQMVRGFHEELGRLDYQMLAEDSALNNSSSKKAPEVTGTTAWAEKRDAGATVTPYSYCDENSQNH